MLSWRCVVEPEPVQQPDSAGQKEATSPVTRSPVETQGPEGVSDSNVLLQEASQNTNEALDLLKKAAARKRSASQLDRNKTDNLGVQMQHLDGKPAQPWEKLAKIKVRREDGLASQRSGLNDRVAELTKEA